MSLYTADGFEGEPIDCDEGELEWVEKSKIETLKLWEGDKIFFDLLERDCGFFSLKLVYNIGCELRKTITYHIGKRMDNMKEFKPIKEGKVREVYDNGDSLIITATDRISAFDVILKNEVKDR